MAKQVKSSENQSEVQKKNGNFLFNPLTLKKVKYISAVDEKFQSDIVEEAVSKYIAEWEEKNGPIPVK